MRIPTSALWLSAATGAAMMVIAWAALGQPAAPPTGTAPPPGMMMMGPPDGPPMSVGGMRRRMLCEDHDAFLAGALVFARTKLAITDQQAPAWEKFAAAAKAASEPLPQLCAADKPLPLPQRLERRERFETARLDSLKRIRPAVAELYETLTPEQKAAADRMMAMRVPM